MKRFETNQAAESAREDCVPVSHVVTEPPWYGGEPGRSPESSHSVQFYEDDAFLVRAIADFVAAGARAGDSMIVIATAAHLDAMNRQLEASGVDLTALQSDGRLTLLDARETLAAFMRDGRPDPGLFESSVGRIVSSHTDSISAGRRLRAFGEMVDVLWSEGQCEAAIQLEELWIELQRERSFSLLCAYSLTGFYDSPASSSRVCAAHTHVRTQHTASELAPSSQARANDIPSNYAARLASEIAHRQKLASALRETVTKLRSSEAQLRDLVQNAPLGLHCIGQDGTILWANRAELDLLGYSEEEYVGRSMFEFHADPDTIQDILARTRRGEELHHREARLRAKDGSVKDVLISCNAYHRDGELIHIRGFTRDITDQKRLERARSSAARHADRLLTITAAIADAVSSEQVFEAVVDQVVDALGVSSAGLWLVGEDGRTLRLMRARGYHGAARKQFDAVSLDTTPSFPALDAVRRGEPIWIPNQGALLEQYPHLTSVASPGRSYRIACLPLSARGRVLGTLAITTEEPGDASHEEREFLQLVARYTSQAIERLRLLGAERESRQQAQAAAQRLWILNHASRAFADMELDLPSRLRAIVVELAATLDSCINIGLIGPDGLLHLTATHHPISEAQDVLQALAPSAPLRIGEGLTGSIAATGKSVLLPAIDAQMMAANAVPAYREFLERFPAHALIGAPLRVRGRVIGTVTATRVQRGQTYTTEDLRLLEELAERAAVAIENSRLYQEAVGAGQRSEQLYAFAQAVVATDRIDAVYEAALDAIEAALGAKRSAILVFDSNGVMRFRAWHGLSDTYRAAVEGHSPWPRDVLSPKPIVVSDALSDAAMAPYHRVFRQEGIGALAFIPLVTDRRLVGKFMVYYEQPHSFVPAHIETACAIANHLASVIARFASVAKLEDTLRQNEIFAGILAHDLRNPLGAIVMAAQLSLAHRREGRVNADGEERSLTRIVSSGQRMRAMIDQLLDFTRVRSGGGLEVVARAADLGELLKQALGELELAHPDWHIQRDVCGDQRGTWDTDRLLQVLSNLIANAGEHGHPGTPVVVRLDGSDRERVRIEVQNRGAIPESLLPILFEPFRMVQHRRDRSRGLGLGLFIVREIIRAHDGRVYVESSETLGTTFRIDLPRHAGPERAEQPSGAAPELSSGEPDRDAGAHTPRQSRKEMGSRPRVLLVDDDVDIREALSDTLEDRGYAVKTATNGLDALQILRGAAAAPAVILLDLMMPVMDGYGFLDERRKDPALGAIPVIVITAGHGIDRGRLGEATPIVPKPIDVRRLTDTIKAFSPEGVAT